MTLSSHGRPTPTPYPTLSTRRPTATPPCTPTPPHTLPRAPQPPDCDPSLGDCGTWLALPYFLTFFLVAPIIMLNLFTAVIIENFEKTHEQDAWRLTPQVGRGWG